MNTIFRKKTKVQCVVPELKPTETLHSEASKEMIDFSILQQCLTKGAKLSLVTRWSNKSVLKTSAIHELFQSRGSCSIIENLRVKFEALKFIIRETSEDENPLNVYQYKQDDQTKSYSMCQTAFSTILKSLCNPFKGFFENVQEEDEYYLLCTKIIKYCISINKFKDELDVNALYLIGAPWNHWKPTWHAVLDLRSTSRQLVFLNTLKGYIDLDARKIGFSGESVDSSDTALHSAILLIDEEKAFALVRFFVENGANVNAVSLDVEVQDDTATLRVFETALSIAKRLCHTAVYKFLLAAGAQANQPLLKFEIVEELNLKLKLPKCFEKSKIKSGSKTVQEIYLDLTKGIRENESNNRPQGD